MTWMQRFLLGFAVGYTANELFGFWPVGFTAILLCFYLDHLLSRQEDDG